MHRRAEAPVAAQLHGQGAVGLGDHHAGARQILVLFPARQRTPGPPEPLDALDSFADTMIAIAVEARQDPELVKGAPYTTPVRRLDEARAARQPDLRWRPTEG